MKRDMQQTSLEAFEDIKRENILGDRQEKVFEAIKDFGPMTDLEIKDLLGFDDANMVRPRRNELVKKKKVIAVEQRVCKISGRKAIAWGVKD